MADNSVECDDDDDEIIQVMVTSNTSNTSAATPSGGKKSIVWLYFYKLDGEGDKVSNVLLEKF